MTILIAVTHLQNTVKPSCTVINSWTITPYQIRSALSLRSNYYLPKNSLHTKGLGSETKTNANFLSFVHSRKQLINMHQMRHYKCKNTLYSNCGNGSQSVKKPSYEAETQGFFAAGTDTLTFPGSL